MTSANTNRRGRDVDGARLYADTRSDTAPALVLLDYWEGSRWTWPVLTRLHPDQAFVNYDQRGWGDSANAPGPYDVERLADDAQSVVATSGCSDRSRHLADRGVTCAAIPAEATERAVAELIATATGAERHGVRHNVLGLHVVLPDGSAPARFGGENMKDVAGYDTKRLFIGSHDASGPSPPPFSKSGSAPDGHSGTRLGQSRKADYTNSTVTRDTKNAQWRFSAPDHQEGVT